MFSLTKQFIEDGKERVVVGTLDLNQCLWLPDELTGRRPEVWISKITKHPYFILFLL
jgi:hypothetical protein